MSSIRPNIGWKLINFPGQLNMWPIQQLKVQQKIIKTSHRTLRTIWSVAVPLIERVIRNRHSCDWVFLVRRIWVVSQPHSLPITTQAVSHITATKCQLMISVGWYSNITLCAPVSVVSFFDAPDVTRVISGSLFVTNHIHTYCPMKYSHSLFYYPSANEVTVMDTCKTDRF